ncbi:MAG TPA: hypothetical protein VHY78_07865 [Stellaceae bacterium]|jgi:hypothetical protein|nr:hypothetical protein [Stellaceae bacterium]
MFDRVGEVVSVVLGALALGYLIYEIDRRKRKLRDLFYVLDSEDADISAELMGMVDRGELQPYSRGGRA